VACLRVTSRPVYAINPLAVARYRERHAVSGKNPNTPTRSCWPTSCGPTGRPPAAAGRLRAGPRHRRTGSCPTGRGLGPHPGPQQVAVAAARVLPRVAGGVPHHPWRDHTARGPRGAGGCPPHPPTRPS
jgi:hypothetical protein